MCGDFILKGYLHSHGAPDGHHNGLLLVIVSHIECWTKHLQSRFDGIHTKEGRPRCYILGNICMQIHTVSLHIT